MAVYEMEMCIVSLFTREFMVQRLCVIECVDKTCFRRLGHILQQQYRTMYEMPISLNTLQMLYFVE